MSFRWLFIALALFTALAADEPIAVYLTVQHPPEHAITLCWIEKGPAKPQEIKYRQAGKDDWYAVSVSPQPLSFRSAHQLYFAELESLSPDERYEFILPHHADSYFFRTLPASLKRPVKLIVGGDVYHDEIEIVEAMNRIAASQQPDVAIVGGDIAYAGSKVSFFRDEGGRWLLFLKTWSETMVRPDGTLIPIIPVIGNHDVNGRFAQTPQQAQLFYFFFPCVEGKYRQLCLGNFLSLWLLDSGHTHAVAGEQTRWLAETLKQWAHVPFKFAIYHVPAYPSVRNFSNEKSATVRNFWTPLFEAFRITAAFEHHDHAYKRTHLIRDGKQDPQGILYLGDGAWGVDCPRRPRSPMHSWYLAHSEQTRHVILVTLMGSKATFQALNSKGEVFDTCER
jgi:hypothetical protein